MPLYEFRCTACNDRKEVTLPLEKRDAEHIQCGCGYQMVRVLSAPGIQFKGGGFYSTGG